MVASWWRLGLPPRRIRFGVYGSALPGQSKRAVHRLQICECRHWYRDVTAPKAKEHWLSVTACGELCRLRIGYTAFQLPHIPGLKIRSMISVLKTKTLASVVLAVCAATTPIADAQTTLEKKSLGVPGWELHQKGDVFADPATAEVRAIYVDGTMKFAIGCTSGSLIDVTWHSSKPLSGPEAKTSFSIDGRSVASRVFQARAPDSARSEHGWSEQGGDALNLVQAIYGKWVGALVISGGGVTDKVPFDEEKMGGVSELVLFACGQ